MSGPRSPRLIGLAGAGGAGKSTAAQILREIGFEVVVTGAPLKAGLRAMLASLGVSGLTIERMVEGDLKRAPCRVLAGKSPTEAMQSLGSDWGRDMIGAGVWIDPARRKAGRLLAAGGRVALDNVRFENEAQAVRDLGGEVWRVIGRADMDPGTAAHGSERFGGPYDRILRNVGTREDLVAAIFAALDRRGDDPSLEQG
jgi:hypothetical protein